MASESKDYFIRRAAQEREAADHAADERARQSHRELARRYLQLADNDEGRQRADVS